MIHYYDYMALNLYENYTRLSKDTLAQVPVLSVLAIYRPLSVLSLLPNV